MSMPIIDNDNHDDDENDGKPLNTIFWKKNGWENTTVYCEREEFTDILSTVIQLKRFSG